MKHPKSFGTFSINTKSYATFRKGTKKNRGKGKKRGCVPDESNKYRHALLFFPALYRRNKTILYTLHRFLVRKESRLIDSFVDRQRSEARPSCARRMIGAPSRETVAKGDG